MLLSTTTNLVKVLPKITGFVGVVVGLDWIVFTHRLFADTPFFANLSFYTALLIALASYVASDYPSDAQRRNVSLTGLVLCAILGFSNLQALLSMGTASPPTLAAFSCLFAVSGLNANQSTSNEFSARLVGIPVAVGIQALFVFGLMTWHFNDHAEIGHKAFSFFSPATGTSLFLLSVCYLDRFCIRKKHNGKTSPARDMLIALSLVYPLIISSGMATGTSLTTGYSDEIVLGVSGAITALLTGLILMSFGWSTFVREETALTSLEQAKEELALQLGKTQHLEKQSRQLAQSNEAYANEQRHFSTMLAHEIRTPLNTITGLISSFGSQHQANQNCGMKYCFSEFDQIKASTDYLYDLVNSVLDYNKLKEGRLELVAEAYSPSKLISAIDHFYRDRAVAKGLSVTMTVCPDVPDSLIGDAIRIRQVLSNLMDNAIKFTESGSIELHACMGNDKAGLPQLEFHIEDTGIGIHQGDLVKIFEPFRQANAHIRSKFGGTGVGLSLCKDLAHLMKGDLEVTSQLGVGSVFKFSPPMVEAKTAEHLKTHISKTLTNKKLLMVEDHHINGKINQKLLESAGYTVDWVDTGEKAVEAAGKSDYDAILMDLDLGPGISGYEASRRIRMGAKRENTVVIALTAGITHQLVEKLQDAGIGNSLEKPFRVEEAVRLISKAIVEQPNQKNLKLAPTFE